MGRKKATSRRHTFSTRPIGAPSSDGLLDR